MEERVLDSWSNEDQRKSGSGRTGALLPYNQAIHFAEKKIKLVASWWVLRAISYRVIGREVGN